jgi:hypothetical protein
MFGEARHGVPPISEIILFRLLLVADFFVRCIFNRGAKPQRIEGRNL